jgi:hypothetical protein
MNPPSRSVNYGNLPPNQAGQQQALGPAQGGQRPSQTGQTGAQGQVAPNQRPNPQTNQPTNPQTGAATNPATKPAANNQGKSNLGDISKSRNYLIERDLNDDFVRGGGANVISDRLNFSQRRVVQGPPQIHYVDNPIEKVIPYQDAAIGGRRAIASNNETDDSINITARNILAEAEAKVALLIMEGHRLKWLEAQRREELRRLKSQAVPLPPTTQPPVTRVVQSPVPAPPTTRVVQQSPSPQPTTRVVQQPAVVSTSPVVQRVSQTNPVVVQQPTRVVRAEPTTTYVQQPTTTYVQQPATTYVQQPATTTYVQQPGVVRSTSPVVRTSQTYVTGQPTTTYATTTGPVVRSSQTYISGQPTSTVVRGPTSTTTQVIPAGGATYTTQRPSQTTRVIQQGPVVTTVPSTTYTTVPGTTTQSVYPTTNYVQGQPTSTYVR